MCRYRRLVLAIAAAVVPIIASLYVAGSMLAEYRRRAHDARVWARVSAREAAEREALPDRHDPHWSRLSKEITARRMMLLEANGVDRWLGTMKAYNDANRPQAPATRELRRQWALLWGSAAGVLLLALDVAVQANG